MNVALKQKFKNVNNVLIFITILLNLILIKLCFDVNQIIVSELEIKRQIENQKKMPILPLSDYQIKKLREHFKKR